MGGLRVRFLLGGGGALGDRRVKGRLSEGLVPDAHFLAETVTTVCATGGGRAHNLLTRDESSSLSPSASDGGVKNKNNNAWSCTRTVLQARPNRSD